MKRTASRPSSPSAPRLIGYVRVSTEEQASRGVSLADQRDRLAAYARAYGFVLVGIEEDAGLSGGLPYRKRPGLSRALEAVRRGEAEALAVTDLTRLTRSSLENVTLITEADKAGWRLISVTENLDLGTSNGRMVATILGALAQAQREKIKETTKYALARVAREGRARSRVIPFGHRLEGSDATVLEAGDRSRLVKDEAEQALLARMLALRAEGLGTLRVTNAMNDAGTVNPRTGLPWARYTVASILATADRRARALANA